jgi:uncharacterized protein GlcG (DUF336 family)
MDNAMKQIISRVVPSASVSREAGDGLVAAALEAAKRAGFEASIAIVDAGGALRSFARTDGASAMTADVAVGKAWTAATSGFPTHVWNQILADPKLGPLVQLPGMMAISGGHPIVDDGKVVGAIGVSGGMNDQDLDAALTALRAVGFTA